MLTLITAVYNRANLIKRLYESLREQTSKHFQWMVVDDGSTDNLTDLIEFFMRENIFCIKYVKLPHGGKHRAINYAIRMSNTDSVVIVDSDDVLRSDAVEKFSEWWKEVKNDDSFVGAAGLMIDAKGQISGGFPKFEDCIDILWSQRRDYGINGESVYVFRRKELEKCPLPEYEGELFCSEVIMMEQLSRIGKKIRWHRDVVYQYEYQEDGLSKNIDELYRSNPKGYARVIYEHAMRIRPSQIQYLQMCRDYYELCYKYKEDEEIREILGISVKERTQICEEIVRTKRRIEHEIAGYTSFALYGFGAMGHRMKNYLYLLGREVEFFIDKNAENIKVVRVYCMSQEFPDVQVIIVCIKQGATQICDMLRSKNNRTTVLDMNELYCEW